jgi:hypothetical protein
VRLVVEDVERSGAPGRYRPETRTQPVKWALFAKVLHRRGTRAY